MNPNVNYEHWVIIMCQCRFTDCNKYSTLVLDVDNKGGCIYMCGNTEYVGTCIFSNLL